MNPLEIALRPLTAILNRNIRATTPARELCEQLAGSVIAVRVDNTALAAWFIVRDDELELTTDCNDEADAVISGSLMSLARMATESDLEALRDGSIELAGDAHVADSFSRLLALAKPDVEEELSGVVGDTAAYRLGEIARGVANWGREARATMGANIREYLQEESRDVPSRYEVDKFSDKVGRLRDDVARLEARINRLQDGG